MSGSASSEKSIAMETSPHPNLASSVMGCKLCPAKVPYLVPAMFLSASDTKGWINFGLDEVPVYIHANQDHPLFSDPFLW